MAQQTTDDRIDVTRDNLDDIADLIETADSGRLAVFNGNYSRILRFDKADFTATVEGTRVLVRREGFDDVVHVTLTADRAWVSDWDIEGDTNVFAEGSA